MCLSIPGKIVEIKENGMCVIDYETEKRAAKIIDKDTKIGDYVVINGGMIVMKIPKEQAKKFLEVVNDRR